MMLTLTGNRIVIRDPEHISSTSERVHLCQTDSHFLLNAGSFAGAEADLTEGGPAIVQLVLESEAASIAAPVALRVVSPHTGTIMAVLFTERSRSPPQFSTFHIFSIDERLNVSLLCAFRVHGKSVNVHMRGSLEFNRAAGGIRPVEGDRQITV